MPASQLDEHAIFAVAIKIPDPEARAAYLSQVCENDASMFDRVSALVATHEADSRFLHDPPPGVNPTIDVGNARDLCGKRIGRYKLLQEIGEGGFGMVYMAEQTEPVRRKVAIKVVKPGMDSREVLARFEAERQALALMDHPNIARVLDAGTTDSGHPYFVMELVKGVNITQFADDNNLSTRARMKLLAKVCRAVQHAHQKGIIHRDIKPSNVLVTLHDGEPVPKIIDFGVSKALSQQLTEKTLFTRYGQVIGTPQYMSPEQAELSGLDVDTRSDIYALGVLIYELLVGQPPFDPTRLQQAGMDEIRRLIREEEPSIPSHLIRTLDVNSATTVATHRSCQREVLYRELSGELDWITMKALAKDRTQRYATALELSDDIERFLNGEAVEAGPPTLAYRFAKTWRRHRGSIATFAAIAGSLVIGLAISLASLWQTQSALAGEIQAKQVAVQAEERAKERQTHAENETRKANQTLSFLLDFLARSGIDPETGRAITVNEAVEVLGESVEAEESLGDETAAVLHLALAEAFQRSMQPIRARTHFTYAYEYARRVWPPEDSRLADVRRETAFVNKSVEDLQAAVKVDRDLEDQQHLLKSLALLGAVAFEKDQIDIAETALDDAVRLYSPDVTLRFEEIPHLIYADLLERQGDSRAAADMRQSGIEIARKRFGEEDKGWYLLAETLVGNNNRQAATRAVGIAKTCDSTVDSQWFVVREQLHTNFSWAVMDHCLKLAAEEAKKAADLQTMGKFHMVRARLRYCSGDLEGAEAMTREVVKLAEDHEELTDPVRWWSLLELGFIQLGLDETEAARSQFARYLDLADWESIAATQGQDAATRFRLVTKLLAGQPIDREQAGSFIRDQLFIDRFYNGSLALNLFIELDDFEVEEIDAKDAFEYASRDRWAWEPLYPRREDHYIAMMDQQDDLERASRFFDELLARRDAEFEVVNPERAWTRKRLARILLLRGAEPQRTIKLLDEAITILEQNPLVPQQRIEELTTMIEEAEELRAN